MTDSRRTNQAAGADESLTLPAPGKINRFLRILGQRHDGYHRLQTQFQFIELADEIKFVLTKSPRIRRIDRHPFALPSEDLCLRAANLLRARLPQKTRAGVVITLRKRIPPGSGLGGGSSNAATTLIALNHLWRLRLRGAQLAELALQLGADVPFFIRGTAADASGIGEILRPCKPRERYLCLCIPAARVSTAAVFARFAARQTAARKAAQPSADSDRRQAEEYGNDLEAITAELYPPVAAALAAMRKLCRARMSGSGGAIYAEFDDRDAAEKVALQLPAHCNAQVTRARNRSALHRRR